ncbi:hypothetical protein PLICRDRAFT_41860 [Plicaturopsis crispa FD-325 SS-3]|nr:hypothetical protein PLICRDRAFT_41860 [Plicaturopsis crispa FD-325 SS-3]
MSLWTKTDPLLPYLGRSDPENTIGLHNATLFDVPEDNSGVNSIDVGATAFNATCGMIHNATALNINVDNPAQPWYVRISYEGSSFAFDAKRMAPYVIRQKTYSDMSFVSHAGELLARNVVFYSSINISDSSGNNGSSIILQPPMVQEATDQHPNRTMDRLQIMGCTISLVKQQAVVDAQKKSLISVSPTAEKTASAWSDWHPELQPSDSGHWSWIKDPNIDAWGDMLHAMPITAIDANGACSRISDACDELNYAEEYLMGRLGLYPEASSTSGFEIDTPPTLHAFENALAAMTASLYWAAANVRDDQFVMPGQPTNLRSHAQLLQGSARISLTESRLNLSIVPIAFGLGVSIVLLALAVVLTRPPDGHGAVIDSVGVLQLLWLMNRRPSLHERVSQVDVPTMDNLRAAGMFNVRVASAIPIHQQKSIFLAASYSIL